MKRIRTKIILPKSAIFDLAGNGLHNESGNLAVDAGAGFAFNEWGTLILSFKEGGGIGLFDERLCVNPWELAPKLAGLGIAAVDGKLCVNVPEVAGFGLEWNDGKVNVDLKEVLEKVVGPGLKMVSARLTRVVDEAVNTGDTFENHQGEVSSSELADTTSTEQNGVVYYLEIDTEPEPTYTVTITHLVDSTFRYKPSHYSYSGTLEFVKSYQDVDYIRNCVGVVVGVVTHPVRQLVEDVPTNPCVYSSASVPPPVREESVVTPNFYSE